MKRRICVLLVVMILFISIANISADGEEKLNTIDNPEFSVKKYNMPFNDEDINNEFSNYSHKTVDFRKLSTENQIMNQGESGHVVGEVYDRETGKLVIDATIIIVELDVETKTDSNGRFEITSVPEGTYNISIDAEGYFLANYSNMPILSSSGIEIYNLAISSTNEVVIDYLEDIESHEEMY